MCARLRGVNRWAMVVILVFGGTLLAAAPYGGGTGEPNDPYLIYTAEQMDAIGANPGDWASHFKLMADLDLSEFTGRQFHLIGPSFHYRFSGVFDGNGHTISNFTYTAGSGDYVGLFGYVDDAYGAEIKNLGLINPRVTASGGSEIGSLVGHLRGTITNCYTRGGRVWGRAAVGGLVGESHGGTILNCYSTSAVQGTGNAVGGLVGSYTSGRYDLIANCYATGAVSGKEYVGGLVGLNGGLLVDCYSTGRVTGEACLGGLVGWGSGSVIGSFWDTQTSGCGSSRGGAGRTSAQMQDAGSFRAVGWDFFGPADGPSDLWTVDLETGYPILWWQVPAGELPSPPTFAGGTGTANDPYRLASAQQLNSIGHNPRLMTAHFKLVSNINLAGVAFWMIGDEQFPFAGDFDGAGRAISNLTYRYDRADLVGLFGCVTGTVRNLTLVNPKVEIGMGHDIGSLVAIVRGGTVRNCRVQGARISGTGGVGGLVGDNDGTIRDCVVNAVVRGESAVGGLAGSTMGMIANCEVTGMVTGEWSGVGGVAGTCASTIANCCADCTVTGGTYQTGGIAGFVQGGVLINCYVRAGSVSGDSQVGGLIGFLNTGDVWNCYSTCAVAGETKVGGLIGSTSIGAVSASFWNVETSGQAVSAGGVGKTSAEMRDPNTFLQAGWDFFGPINGPSDIWTFDSDAQRPVLWWQVPPEQRPELPAFAGGTGTPEDPYRIASAAQLSSIGHNPRLMECSFKLMVDIDLTDTTFFPIGGLAAPFSATFDGDHHTISHLSCVRTGENHVGFLGHVEGSKAQLKNVRLSSPQVSAGTWPYGECAGALVGYVQGATLLNCRVEGGTVFGWRDVGGLAGSIAHSSIRNCAAATAVTGDYATGGLIGHGLRSSITACQATGRVTAGEAETGGLLGTTDSVTIRDSFAKGPVTGAGGTGGLVGWAIHGTVTRCHAAGAVSGGIFTGGLLGDSDSIVTDCHATGTVSGTNGLGGLIGSSLGVVAGCYASGAVTGDSSIGGLVGDNGMGPIDRSHADGAVTGKKDVGGLAGKNDSSAAITDCAATGAVIGESNVGGLTGHNTDSGKITGCRASGTVLGQMNVGGLAGFNDDHGWITDCYASGGVSGQGNVGGLVGRNGERIDPNSLPVSIPSEFPGIIVNCYSSGPVSGVTQAGGLVGFHHWGSITASFWDTQTSGQPTSAGGTGNTTADMWIARTFLGAGWDIAGEAEASSKHVWWILEGQDYPRLWWEHDPDQP